jgi:hypothetical protein
MSLDVWVAILAFILLAVGAAISIHPPQKRQWKIVSFVTVVVAGLLLLTLTVFQATGHKAEQEDAISRERHLQESLDRSEKGFSDLRREVVDATKRGQQPGSSDERLNSVLSDLAKALGRPVPVASSTTLPSLSPIATGTATLKMMQATTVLTTAVTKTSKILLTGQDDDVLGSLRVTNIVPGVSFDIVSSNGTDAGRVFWIRYP